MKILAHSKIFHFSTWEWLSNGRNVIVFLTSTFIVKSVSKDYRQCRISLELGKNIGSSIISHNYLHNYRSFNFLENHSVFFFFCTLHLKLTNLEVRHLIQVTESLIFTNLEISIFCAVQETSRHLLNKLQVQNVFVFSSLYDPFYCNRICFTIVF